MQIPYAKQTALGITAAIVVIAGIVAAWILLPRPQIDAAMQLPASKTLALFQNVNRTTIRPFVSSFPILDGVPLTDSPVSIAILRTQTGGELGWAVLTRTTNADQPFTIRASSSDIQTLLLHVTDPLNRSYTYSQLLPDEPKNPWAYLRFPDIQPSPASPAATLLTISRPASVALMADGLSIRTLASSAESRLESLPAAPKDVFSHPLFIAEMQDLGNVALDASTLLHPDATAVSQSVLRSALASLFGPSISPRYDMVPLLRGPTTLQVAAGTGTHLRVVIEGNTTDRDGSMKLDHLIQLFTNTLTPVTRDVQTFDNKFTFEDVRQDPSLISDATATDGTWTVRTITQTQTHSTLLVATRGGDFVLSNDQAAFEKTIHASSPDFPAMEPAPAGLGLIQSDALSALLTRSIPTVWNDQHIASGTGGYLKWKLSREGQRLTVVIKRI
ncbi:MAG TPA: hypothetical protein VHA78_04350 [Candidatus Peribacteraceae bacterium]|nr:hypothetical protein [Candidatus Peribacteraceae bacterium]